MKKIKIKKKYFSNKISDFEMNFFSFRAKLFYGAFFFLNCIGAILLFINIDGRKTLLPPSRHVSSFLVRLYGINSGWKDNLKSLFLFFF